MIFGRAIPRLLRHLNGLRRIKRRFVARVKRASTRFGIVSLCIAEKNNYGFIDLWVTNKSPWCMCVVRNA